MWCRILMFMWSLGALALAFRTAADSRHPSLQDPSAGSRLSSADGAGSAAARCTGNGFWMRLLRF